MPFLRWEVGPDVPDSFFYPVRQGLLHVREYMNYLGLSELDGQVTLYFYWDMIPALARVKGGDAETLRQWFGDHKKSGSEEVIGKGSAAIFKDASVLTTYNSSPGGLTHSGGHSLVHSYQQLLPEYRENTASHSEVYLDGPAWLLEGGAEFQTIRSFEMGGSYVYEQRRKWYRERAETVNTHLSQLETYGDLLATEEGYQLSTMAVELLAAHAGEKAVINYWKLLGPGTTWQDAFEAAFGMTPAQFYPKFAQHRATGFPELDLPSIAPSIEDLPQVDRQALVAFYNATGGPAWTNSSKWLSDAHIGHWHGVKLNRSGRVVELRLTQNALKGNLPPALGSLTELRRLTLWANGLTGAIPPELASLTKLETFSVGGNQMTGSIPSWLGNLSNLRELHLVSNRFSGQIPLRIGELPLSGLYLARNRLSGDIPSEIRHLSGLRALFLDGNNLTGCIPVELRDVPDNDIGDTGLSFCDP